MKCRLHFPRPMTTSRSRLDRDEFGTFESAAWPQATLTAWEPRDLLIWPLLRCYSAYLPTLACSHFPFKKPFKREKCKDAFP